MTNIHLVTEKFKKMSAWQKKLDIGHGVKLLCTGLCVL